MEAQSVKGAVYSAGNFTRVLFPVQGWRNDNAEVAGFRDVRQCVAINRNSWESSEIKPGGAYCRES